MDAQGGKRYGLAIDEVKKRLAGENQDILEDDIYKDVEDLPDKLKEYAEKFIQMDKDMDGVIGVMDMKKAMEELGQAKTHLEIMKMIREVDKENKDAINYSEFINMMLGAKTTVLKLILLFEEKAKEKEKPKMPPAKRTLDSLP